MSEVSKLKIVSYKDTTSSQRLGEFVMQLNPVDISVVKTVEAPKDSSSSDGSAATSQTETFRPAKYTFKFTLDDTGAISLNLPNSYGVAESISMLESLTVVPNDETHQNPYVYLYWGNTFQDSYFGQVSALKYNYNFFSISGNPLRALVTLTITEVNATIDRTFQSPDITKIPVIKDKDNIVKISKDSYDDQKYYIRIAEINNLSSVRELKKGSSIVLPPIKK
ncbi:hypothetical protein N9N76_01545 [Flavobacteriaceae bacterium]|nr:hypothetical protein [Flavobacteriaceae bacterium]